MQLWQSIIMGTVQGLTEFLPISSSAHLAIFSSVFGYSSQTQGDLVFEIMLHMGTLFAVLFAYWKDIVQLIKELFKSVGDIFTGRFTFKNMSPTRKFLLMIIVATLPLFIIAPFSDYIEHLSGYLWLIGVFLLLTALMLYLSDRLGKRIKDTNNSTFKDAFIVGLFQAVATCPGISRSGATITGGLLRGFKRDYAVKFSFIMSLPAIIGANILSLKDVLEGSSRLYAPVGIYIAGVVTAAIVGYACIRLLKYIINNDKFVYFAYYCAAVGLGTIFYTFFS